MRATNVLYTLVSILPAIYGATPISISTCAELVAAPQDDDLVITVSTDEIFCSEYTTITVSHDVWFVSDSKVTLRNLRFIIEDSGSMVVDHSTTFQDVVEEEVDGGVFNVAKGGTVTFNRLAEFRDNSIQGASSMEDVRHHAAAIYNMGSIVFKKKALFKNNLNDNGGADEPGEGGAIYNGKSGTIDFRKKLTMVNNRNSGSSSSNGGGIYNLGKVTVKGDAVFKKNRGQGGGCLWNEGGKVIFKGPAVFRDSFTEDGLGAACANNNFGTLLFKSTSLFVNGFAESFGDGGSGGALSNTNGALLTLTGKAIFKKNYAGFGGAIYNPTSDGPVGTLVLPDDVVFKKNTANVACPDIYYDDDHCGPT